ncbi:50S ribosomal protein L3 [Patescibacteria group bacterium]|nr:50S ribosomal protein L3 [Patescibacteria group bacterium]
MKFILGKKIGMSQIFVDNEETREVIPVTLIESQSCVLTDLKTINKDGYEAVQVGFMDKKKINKPLLGHLKDLGKFRYLQEFRTERSDTEYKKGDKIDVSIFQVGDEVHVSGVSKSKGFQGVMKRHNFKGGPASHGQKHSNRKCGSIGSAFPEHVIKGKRMAGRMGGVNVTQKGLKIVQIDKERNLLLIKGSVPGNIGSLIKVLSD